ncbi:MAG: rhodanese-like domain-containing protein [Gammaproteobacteria bacterium]
MVDAGIISRLTVTVLENPTGMTQFLEFAGNHPFLVSALVALTLIVIVNEVRIRAGGGTSVSPADAVKLINNGAIVVDVRTQAQFQQGHIVNARNLPLAELGENDTALAKLRDKVVVTCCDTGMGSGKAARLLRDKGVAGIANLQGGLAAWQRDSLPLVSGKKTGDTPGGKKRSEKNQHKDGGK